MSLDIKPSVIPEQIRCANYGCCCKQSNYDNHPEGKAPPTYVYDMPDDDNKSWVMKHTWFHLCWELGIEDPFYVCEDEVRALAINVLRLMHQEIFDLRKKLKEYELEEAKEYGGDEAVCIWPDGTYCMLEDLEEYLTMMSDDYKIVHIDSDEARRAIGE